MPETTNNSKINIESSLVENSSDKTMISVNNVGMTFNMASEQLNNLKEYFLAIVKHNLIFEELRALEDINFEIKQGDVFGIVGTNGSGKSTLLKIVAGVLEPTDGSVEINGNIAPLIELGAGFDMELSARENIYLNGALLGHSKEFINEHFDEIVEFSEIEKFLDMPMKNYSSGMIARIAFAIATVIIPEILIVDEVLSVGDFMFQKKCEDKILDLITAHNTTVLIVSHSTEQIRRLCNKAIWIEKGHTRMLGSAEEVCDIYSLVGGREGSLEAEHTILEAFENYDNENAQRSTKIAQGGTYTEVSLSLERLAQENDVETACLACESTHLNMACANSISGTLNAPVISFPEEGIDFHILDWLESKKPKQIYIFNAQHCPAGDEYKTHTYSWNPQIKEIEVAQPDPLGITLDFFDGTKGIVNYSNEALITSLVSYQETTILLSEFCNSRTIPHFSIDINEEDTPKYLKLLKSRNINKLILAGRYVQTEAVELCKQEGFEVADLTDIIGESLVRSQNNIHDYVIAQNNKNAWNEAVVASNEGTMHITGSDCGHYCSTKHSHSLIVDNTHLDSIAYAVKFIQDNKIEKLTFLGGPGALSKSVVDLLSKVAASNQ